MTLHAPHLDAICRLVAAQCEATVALITILEGTQWQVVGSNGRDLIITDSVFAPCADAMERHDVTTVTDLLADARFDRFPITFHGQSMRFYAGAPMITPEGIAVGVLSIWDAQPRETLRETDGNILRLMADAAMDRLLLHRAREGQGVAASDKQQTREDSEGRFRILANTMPQMVWSARPDGFCDYFNARWCAFTGQSTDQSEGNGWLAALHPDDLDRSRATWAHSIESGETYEIEYRLRRADGQYRWALTRGLPMRDAQGRIERWFGTCTDIHDHKIEQEERDLISQELAHRIKNIFAVISGLIGLSARASPDMTNFAEALRDRILALGRAHDFVRPQGRPTTPHGGGLHGLLHEIFAPYEDGKNGNRIALSGDDVEIDDRSATPLALAFHEIVTNAAKYGALSVAEGHVTLHIERSDTHVDMTWQERGGPKVSGGRGAGFGSRLLDLSMRRQLGGTYEQDWAGRSRDPAKHPEGCVQSFIRMSGTTASLSGLLCPSPSAHLIAALSIEPSNGLHT